MPRAIRYETEVAVVGGGLSGLTATLELLEAGRKVVLIDRAPRERLGGLASRSRGGFFFVDSPEQRRLGIRDTPELALSDWLRFAELGPRERWPRRWAEAYVHNCLHEVRGWLRQRGVAFSPAVEWHERGYYVPGNSVPRFHLAFGGGPGLVASLERELAVSPARPALTLLMEHAVDELLTEGNAVVGCAARDLEGTRVEVRADATLLASGGLAGSLERVRARWPKRSGAPPELNGAMPEADGAGIELAAGVGARANHLSRLCCHPAGVRPARPLFEGQGLSLLPGRSAVWLDYQGRRFADPPLVGSYDTAALAARIAQSQRPHSWMVLNWTIAKRELAIAEAMPEDGRRARALEVAAKLIRAPGALMRELVEHGPDVVTARSVAELVHHMNEVDGTADVTVANVTEALTSYDAALARGPALENDDQIRRIRHARRWPADRIRTCNLQPILDPRALPLVGIRAQLITHESLGGVEVDLHARALTRRGRPIPGLYAAGAAAGFGGGGMHGHKALGGTFLGAAVYTGRVAARAIAYGSGADGSLAS